MITITIRGKQGEGKTRIAEVIQSFAIAEGKKVFLSEEGEKTNKKVDILIITRQI
jgi:hypothetical protein